MAGIIYIISCAQTPKQYIGKTKKTLEQRWADHHSDFKRFQTYVHTPGTKKRNFCTHLYRAMTKYGIDTFKIEQIAEADSKGKLSELETQLIEKYNTLSPNGFNLTTGGEGGWEHSPELKEQMRQNTIKGIHKNIDKLRKNELSKGLPVHVIYTVLKGDKEAFLIQRHPLCNQKEFKVDDYESLEDAKYACLGFLEALEITGPYKHPKRGNNLPRGIRSIIGGVQVKKMHKGTRYIKDFIDDTKTLEENTDDAKKYLEILVMSWK